MSYARPLIHIALVFLFAGCAASRPTPPPAPKVELATQWKEPAPEPAQPLASDWWQAFNSKELANLVSAGLEGSPDLGIAAERVRQAEAQVRIAGASLFPLIELFADTAYVKTRTTGVPTETAKSTSATATASYELDVWGRNRLNLRSSEALLGASRFDYETVRLTLVAGIASAYFEVLSLRARLATARENLAVAERVLGVVDARFRNGAVTPLDVARQRAEVFTQRAAIPPLELQERQTLAALAVLVGRVPMTFDVAAANMAGLVVPAVVAGLPSELLVRRPDIASAEARLVAANADLGAARAALLPSIVLTASGGAASSGLLSLSKSPTSTVLSAVPSLFQPIFDGGLRRGEVELAAARERELVDFYRVAILAAFADVENALVAANRTRDQEQAQQQQRDEALRALRLAEIRYREGADDLVVVLDAQRTLFQAQDQLAQVRLSRLQAAVALYKALGGGWTVGQGGFGAELASEAAGGTATRGREPPAWNVRTVTGR